MRGRSLQPSLEEQDHVAHLLSMKTGQNKTGSHFIVSVNAQTLSKLFYI